jgi:predicted ATPase
MPAIAASERPTTSGARPLQEVTLQSFLSFGPDTPSLELQPLNVLIGPNGSGKSNLIEAIALMRATPTDPRAVLRRGGGVREWIWKGETSPAAPASVALVMHSLRSTYPLRHVFEFRELNQAFDLTAEKIESCESDSDQGERRFSYDLRNGRPIINGPQGNERVFDEEYDLNASILAQIKDPQTYPEITHLARSYATVRIYREWTFGRNTLFREPQPADARSDRLEEDFSNLGLFLNQLRRQPKVKRLLLSRLRDLYEGLEDFDVSVEGGTVQVFFTEGDFTVPATRLSDGTLRYLCLLAILCDPNPPPLVCLEEPELGLHPDILPRIADLLIEASQRMQLIVTTHSEIIVDALTEHPEAVVVCEKHQGQTQMRRLGREPLQAWLERYRLGQLWTRGDLGGTRW